MANTLFISCAEPSGDRLAAELLVALREQLPDVKVRGCCGHRLRALGAEPVVHMEDISVMGISAVLPRLPQILRARQALSRAALSADAAVFIDGPSLHLPIAQQARSKGIFTIGYVCPQVWAWKADRAATIGRAFDRLLCLFDFEVPLLQAAMATHGGLAHHVGHPLLDRLPPQHERRPEPGHFALLPGSRRQELIHHLPTYLDVAARVRTVHPETRFTLVSPEALPVPDHVQQVDDVRAIQHCQAALTKSGTVTLELAQMGVPQVVAHRVSALTHAAGRLLVRHVDHVAMPNVLARRPLVPEFLGTLHPQPLADALLTLPAVQPVDLQALGITGASKRAAAHVAQALTRSR